ncbi:MAG TPA: serine hydrolase domain-containing protein [Pseudogracilibacillus sp.]|nr:serine hydrolase domain-containing protein [Pseudogracilibacillus sp.]
MKKVVIILIFSLLIMPMSIFAEEEAVPSGMPDSQVENKVDTILEKYVGEEKVIPGAAVAIVKDGEVLLEKGYGFANLEEQVKVDPEETVFEAASISKLYTWSAVMQLVEEGEINLKQDIRHYLPDHYLEREFSDTITMNNLMNHTAGFEDKAENLLTEDPDKVIPLKTYLSKGNNQPKQVFRPGEVTAYSNFGVSLAGYIVENISGVSFADYMQKNILDKLEMDHSTFKTDYSQLPEITAYKSTGYSKEGRDFTPMNWAYVNDAPAGALNTTVHDMAKFALAQLDADDYQLFNKSDTLEDMHKQTSEEGNTAHGFWKREINDHHILQHGGNSTGFTTQMYLVPEEDFGLILLMNVSDEMSPIRYELVEAFIGEQKHSAIEETKSGEEKVEGTYRMARGMYSNFQKMLSIVSNQDIEVKNKADGGIELQSALLGQQPVQYRKTADLTYERVNNTLPLLDKLGEDTSQVHFKTDGDDEVITMSFGGTSDLLPVAIQDRVDVNQGIIIISLLTFIITVIITFSQWLIRKRKSSVKIKLISIMDIISWIGLITLINIGIMIFRFIRNPFQEIESNTLHIWLNWLMPFILILGIYIIMKQWKTKTPGQNGARVWMVVVSSALVLFLWNFNLL